MSERISQRILIGELVVIVLPLSLLLLIATIVQTSATIKYFSLSLYSLYDFFNIIFALIACISLISGYVISQRFLRQGKAGLDLVEAKWWAFAILGAILTIASGFISLLPHPPQYTAIEVFREAFDLFRLGIPILIPLTHILLEKQLRKQ